MTMIINVRDGLIWRAGQFLNALEADDIAEANGFTYAENFVRAHDGKILHLSRRSRIMLTDEDWCPFGKYGPGKGDQRRIKDVPASYLLYLWDEWMYEIDWPEGRPPNHRWLREYVWENFKALEADASDTIVRHKPEEHRAKRP